MPSIPPIVDEQLSHHVQGPAAAALDAVFQSRWRVLGMVEKLLVRKRLLQGEDTRLAVLRVTLPDVLCPNHSVGSMLFHCEREVLALAQASEATS